MKCENGIKQMLLGRRWHSAEVRETVLEWHYKHVLVGHGAAAAVSAALQIRWSYPRHVCKFY